MIEIREYESGLYGAGQPSAADLASLTRDGVRTIINLRGPDEATPFDEAEEAARLGLRYVSIPVSGGADLHESTIRRFSAALDEARIHGGALVHCASANRVGALVALERALMRGASATEALAVGRRAGLAGLEPAVTALLGKRTPEPDAREIERMYRKESNRTVDDIFADFETAAKAEGFGVLHHYDFRKILAGKGFPIDKECRVLEVCNPRQASEVLATDMALNMALPCRVSIYQDGGKTIVGMIPPTQMLALMSDDPRIAEAARSVERSMKRIIEAVTK